MLSFVTPPETPATEGSRRHAQNGLVYEVGVDHRTDADGEYVWFEVTPISLNGKPVNADKVEFSIDA